MTADVQEFVGKQEVDKKIIKPTSRHTGEGRCPCH